MSKGNGTGIRFVEPPVARKIVVSLLCPACAARLEKQNIHKREDPDQGLPFVVVDFRCVNRDCATEVSVRIDHDKVQVSRIGQR